MNTRNKTERKMKKAEMKLVLYLLQDKTNAEKGYRDISKNTGLSIGSVHGIMRNLINKGYIAFPDAGRTLRKRTNMAEWWARGYADSMKEKMLLGRFRFLTPGIQERWQDISLPAGAMWGGEPAAYLIDGYLHPGKWDIYTETDLSALIRTGKMVPDANGNIYVYSKFWKGNDMLVPVIYADLLATDDDRCREAAERLKDRL